MRVGRDQGGGGQDQIRDDLGGRRTLSRGAPASQQYERQSNDATDQDQEQQYQAHHRPSQKNWKGSSDTASRPSSWATDELEGVVVRIRVQGVVDHHPGHPDLTIVSEPAGSTAGDHGPIDVVTELRQLGGLALVLQRSGSAGRGGPPSRRPRPLGRMPGPCLPGCWDRAGGSVEAMVTMAATATASASTTPTTKPRLRPVGGFVVHRDQAGPAGPNPAIRDHPYSAGVTDLYRGIRARSLRARKRESRAPIRIPGQSAIGVIPPFEGIEDGEKDDGRQAGIEVRTQRTVRRPRPQVRSETPARNDREPPDTLRGGSDRGHGLRTERSAPRPDDQARRPRVRRPKPRSRASPSPGLAIASSADS